MTNSRASFLQTNLAIERCLDIKETVYKSPSDICHNDSARVLRNGLAVVVFASLESFARDRIGEILSRISLTSIPFDDLPDKLREFCVVRALRAVTYQTDLRKRQRDDFIGFAQQQASAIASTSTAAYSLSQYSLLWDRPNLSALDLGDALGVMGVKDAWNQIDEIASRMGMSSPSYRDVFSAAAARRHEAAHSAKADSEWGHLKAFVQQARAIALSFDALASRALKYVLDQDSSILSSQRTVRAIDVDMRFVDQSSDGFWRERDEMGGYVFGKTKYLDEAREACLKRKSSHAKLIVVRNLTQSPFEWHMPYVD